MKRKCAICNSDDLEDLFTQNFIIVGNNSNFSYNIVACKKCGFTYASNIPSQENYEEFYKKSTKYSLREAKDKIPLVAEESNKYYYSLINSYIGNTNLKRKWKKLRILDIGCGSGYLLNNFKKNGYLNLLGIDPAPSCRVLARRLFDVEVKTFPISKFEDKKKFDLIIATGVLEHLEDLNKNLLKIVQLLKDDGYLFISVPDANHFGRVLREPFLEFSLEHINYFTRKSLFNLLQKYNLNNIYYESKEFKTFGAYASLSFWKKDNNVTHHIRFDKTGKSSIKKYISASYKKLEKIEKTITKLIGTQEKIVIWGAGSLTSRLLATTDLKKANIQFFVDSNKSHQGKKIFGYEIFSPNKLGNSKNTVLIASYVHGGSIRQTLEKEFKYEGKIITLN